MILEGELGLYSSLFELTLKPLMALSFFKGRSKNHSKRLLFISRGDFLGLEAVFGQEQPYICTARA